MRPIIKAIIINILCIAALVGVCEGAILALLYHPELLRHVPLKMKRDIRLLYAGYVRNIIQFMPACAVADEELEYTLRPGVCTFSNIEFRNEFHINSLGVRDDEESLSKPEIIVIGDSDSMGWGVGQDETYAAILEKEGGMKTLNLSVSSYGTVREMHMLKRADLSNLKYLVIQYCDNDHLENCYYYIKKNNLPAREISERCRMARTDYVTQRAYWFGRYFVVIVLDRLAQLRDMIVPQRDVRKDDKSKYYYFSDQAVKDASNAAMYEVSEYVDDKSIKLFLDKDEAEIFINAVEKSGVSLDGVRLITFALNDGLFRHDTRFIAMLKSKLSKPAYPEYIRRMTVCDVSSVISPGDFYILDSHLKPSGHRKIASVLFDAIKPMRQQREGA